MDFKTLQEKLNISDGAIKDKQVTIAVGDLTGSIDELIDYCYNNLPLVINEASVTEADEKAQKIVISGKADYLNVPGMDTVATFTLDEEGNVQALLRYQVLRATPGENDWKFSKSFPDMPYEVNEGAGIGFDPLTQEISREVVRPMDEMYLYNGYFVVTTQAGEDPESDIVLKKGINFVSKLRPDGFLGIIENIFQYKNELTVHGTIRIPRKNDSPLDLVSKYETSQKRFQYPWTIEDDFTWGVPGILLKVELGIDYALAKDKVHFKGDKLYLYAPYNDDWHMGNTNPAFEPMHAFTGSIVLPGADLEMDMIAPQRYGMDEFYLISIFEGLSLNHMAQLAGMTGGSSPVEHLPKELQDMEEKMGKLSLTYATISIIYEDLPDIDLANITFGIGIPDLNWEIWKDHFEIENITAEFSFDYPFISKNTTNESDLLKLESAQNKIEVYGTLDIEEVPFSVYASNESGFTVYIDMEGKQTMPLQKVLAKYAPGINPPSDLTIDVFRGSIGSQNNYSFALAMADDEHPWTIKVGNASFSIQDVAMSLNHDSSGTTGAVSGELMFGDIAKLFVAYESPGSIQIRSWVKEISLTGLSHTLELRHPPVPGDFDLVLTNNSLLIKENENNFDLELATEMEGFGTIALQVQEQSGQFGMAFGIDMHDASPFDLPGLKDLKVLADVVKLDDFLIIVASFDAPNFQFPGLASFNNPALTSNSIPMPKGQTGVVAGLNIHAKWHMDTSDKALKVLKELMGLDPVVDVTLQVSEVPLEKSSLYLNYSGQIMGHSQLDCHFGFMLQQGTPEMFLLGKLTTSIHGQPCIFSVGMSLLANGIYFAGSMEGTIQVEGIQLSNLGLALGMSWELLPSFGFAATIDTPKFDSSVAILIDSIEPGKSMFAGAISDVSLTDILEVFVDGPNQKEGKPATEELPAAMVHIFDHINLTGVGEFKMPATVAESLDHMDTAQVSAAFLEHGKVTIPSDQSLLLLVVNDPGKRWSITDKTRNMLHYGLVMEKGQISVKVEAQIYLAPEGAQLGDLVFPPGFYLAGSLEVLGLKWSSQIEIRKNKGIAATSEINKSLVIFNRNFFQLADKTGKTGPSFSLSTFSQPENEDEELRSPHFIFNGELTLSGITEEAYIRASTHGFEFELSQDMDVHKGNKWLSGDMHMHYRLHGAFESIKNFDAGMDISLTVDGELNLGEMSLFDKVHVDFGKITLSLDVGGSFDIGYDGKEAFVKLDAHFDFNNSKHHFSKELDASNADMTKVGEHVLDELKNILHEMFDIAEHWAEAVEQGLVKLEKGAEQVAHVLKEGFDVVDEEAMKLAHQIGHDFDEIGSAFASVYGSTEKEITKFMSSAGAEAERIADTLQKTFKSDAKAVLNALDDFTKMTPEEKAAALKHTFKKGEEEVAQLFKDLGRDEEEIARALANTFKRTATDAIKIMDKIGIPPEKLGKALKNTLKQGEQDAAKILKGIGKDGEAIGKALAHGFGRTAKQAAQTLKNIGINPDEVGKALKNAFGKPAQEAANIMKSIGHDASHIGSALKNVFKKSAVDGSKILKNIRFGTGNIANALKSAYKHDAEKVTKTLKAIGQTSTDISKAVKSSFKKNAKDMAKLLNSAGFPTDDIGKAMKGAFNQTGEDAAKTLKDIGKTSEDVAKVLKNTFKMNTNDTGKLLKSTFNLSKGALGDAMKGAGYAANEVNKFAEDAFKDVGHAVSSAWHSVFG